MRKLWVLLLGFTVILTIEWASVTSAASQGCCHPSAAKSAAPSATSAAPMASLSTNDVRNEFNASSQKVRVVALLSPTCPDCQSGHAVAGSIQDVRIAQGWDGSRNLGKLFGDALELHQIAWDVYLVYKPGIKWDGSQPPRPTFWMDQLEGVDPSLLLCVNPTRLSKEVGKLIAQLN